MHAQNPPAHERPAGRPTSPSSPSPSGPRVSSGASVPSTASGPARPVSFAPRAVPLSPTLAVNEALARKRREGVRVLPLGFGEAGIPIHPALTRELASASGRGGYGPVAGSAALRAAAAGYWARRGLPTDPSTVVCGPGSKPLLFALLMAIGGDVVVAAPSWVSYAAQAPLAGVRPIRVATPPGEGGVPSPALLADAVVRARAAGRTVRAVIVTLPDNPTGTLASEETVRRLCAAARDLDLVIVSDEIYRDLVHDRGRAVPSPARYAPERTVVTTALSKSLAAGGWRLGVARLPEGPFGAALRAAVLGIASEVWSSAPAPVQHAAAYAFAEPPELVEHVDRSRRLHAAVCRAVAGRFAAAGARVPAPQGAFYVYPDLGPLRDALRRGHGVNTSVELSELLLERYGVGVLPGSSFGEPPVALRLRVAPSLLYGETDEQRLAALASPDPASLPWIAGGLDRLSEVLADLRESARAGQAALA
ncbi:aminotransferase class I/II-fold pyridoxal phosphate-dependent enzyme [Actinomadura nitritigenes]|uniref:Pyridoxal phosphate-dependent aminotransferase n=1 Tax=Actinomadura nitritigenes TaxID=134602 RepID=A0ABS3R376_9ACTN|nr:pyridoxal phosphate-dependent aminotransferase [Actinomadura nitritigenes]MBO2440712.1 pyridoxal phosphate-dependent aminotransferase [Actinomadura nitritigenes]